ncbi:MAG: tRNA wybutosine-synthesizing protein 3 [Thermococcaceae archaeon]|nr:tRNA wybutosine-synthesizing protein 3 [Thermococcaceae archaeon]
MKAKREALNSLFDAIRTGKADDDIIDLLLLINSINGIYTTSSCSGRIGIIEEPALGAKPLSRWLIKVHRPIEFEEAREALNNAEKGIIFLKSQPPIFHVVAEDLEKAKKLHELGLASGFKYTTFKVISTRYLVEINATEYLTAPLGRDGRVLVDDDYLRFAVEIGNEMLRRSKGRLPRLEKNFRKLREELGTDELFYELAEEYKIGENWKLP